LKRITNENRDLKDESKKLSKTIIEINARDEKQNDDDEQVFERARKVKSLLSDIVTKEKSIDDEIQSLALEIPNLSSDKTPTGAIPKVLGYIGPCHPLSASPFSFPSSTTSSQKYSGPGVEKSEKEWKSHVDIGSELGILDFTTASATSGWGWYYLLNDAVRLENALVQYALKTVTATSGWTVVSPPSVTYSHIAAACGFMPRDVNGEQQIYTLATHASKPARCLAGTAEIPLAGMMANKTLEKRDRKVVGVSRCYRSEAGARGVDTKGLYRVHEFTKVEMFAWTKPANQARQGPFRVEEEEEEEEESVEEKVFEEMLSIQKKIISSLGLHARILEMPSTDLGASAKRKIDIEVWFPSRRNRDDGWGEVSSLSMCGDYQSRRLNTRYRDDNVKGWAYTLNGTAMAIPRILAAIIELNWDEQRKSIRVPDVLKPWMDGIEEIKL